MSRVRVRFAPSPTGRLHIGGARTALFNWLFARHEGGVFVLRIEDTDLERSSGDLETAMLEDLRWLGLEWDEGPGTDGARGPYRQSERAGIYREMAERLVAAGAAYPCFCSDEELDRKRAAMLAAGLPPQYDGTCRALDEAGRRRRREEGRAESIRFVVPSGGARTVDDIARGAVEFPVRMVGDFVILRSNGMPTYNFAAAVDDALMEITHVIRGAEHLSNTIRQVLVYEALGMPMPRFAHIPLILGPDRAKLSKRHGAPSVGDYRDRGYPAEAIVNYLAFLGWSTKGESEILGMEDLVAEFDLARVSDSPSIFDEAKLDWISARHIRAGGSARWLEEALPFFPAGARERYDRQALSRIFDILCEDLPSFSGIAAAAAPFMPGIPGRDDGALEALRGAGDLLKGLAGEIEAAPDWSPEAIRAILSGAGKRYGRKGKDLYMPVRAAVTGLTHGPDLTSILLLRGREDVARALRDGARAAGEREGR
ncbi:MAG: glutamate--tRNA ligase [Candidatus Krumholzibacteria bacterium]|nr:glutamate--tRNA ligase [Candidatus Krumholzibacteria bacterium]